MENGPFRMGNTASASRGTGSRVPTRQELATASDEEPPRKPPVHHRTPASYPVEPPRSKKKWIMIGGGIALFVIIASLVAWWVLGRSAASTAIDSSRYQAVFFTNGQVYFGKLQPFNTEYMKLTDIYYLQSQQSAQEGTNSKNPQQTTTDQGNVQLIKLGDEIHGPEDEMIVSKDQMLFYENLKTDGKVAQSIEKHKSSK